MLAPLWGHFQSGANVLLYRMCRGRKEWCGEECGVVLWPMVTLAFTFIALVSFHVLSRARLKHKQQNNLNILVLSKTIG